MNTAVQIFLLSREVTPHVFDGSKVLIEQSKTLLANELAMQM